MHAASHPQLLRPRDEACPSGLLTGTHARRATRPITVSSRACAPAILRAAPAANGVATIARRRRTGQGAGRRRSRLKTQPTPPLVLLTHPAHAQLHPGVLTRGFAGQPVAACARVARRPYASVAGPGRRSPSARRRYNSGRAKLPTTRAASSVAPGPTTRPSHSTLTNFPGRLRGTRVRNPTGPACRR
jgi:hypothetical protein